MNKLSLAEQGKRRLDFDRKEMPVLSRIKEDWSQSRPLSGKKISCCLHITTETALLMETLDAGGAEVRLCPSNPLSTQDDVVAYLNEIGIVTYGKRGESEADFYSNIAQCLEIEPQVIIDDGCDMTTYYLNEIEEEFPGFLGVCEETTTGIIRLRAMEKDGVLPFAAVDVNGSQIKHLFDNHYGTGQSTITGLMTATNRMIAGTDFVVVGYGYCGEGIARDAAGLNARVHVVETDPIKSLRACMDGFNATDMAEAARIGDIFVTATGNKHVIDGEHIASMKDGAVLANSGHFNVEINLDWLEENAAASEDVNEHVVKYQLPEGQELYVLSEGRLVNLCAGQGHPASVMDMSFAGQALSSKWLFDNHDNLEDRVYQVPADIDNEIACIKLASKGMKHQKLTEAQIEYLNSWQEGT